MDNKTKEKCDVLINFWDSALKLTDEVKNEYKNSTQSDDWKEMAPSKKLFIAASSLKDKDYVLDYGCGSGWSSIIMAKSGAKNILSVDTSKNAIEALEFYKELFDINSAIKSEVIDYKWLGVQKEETFDGIICSNVLDVVPNEVTLDIIKNFAKVSKAGANVIIGLNFYLDKELAKARQMELNEDGELYVNGVLRLLNKSSEEWAELFKPYFEVEKLEYFAWPNEAKETRRLFYLKKVKK